MITELGHFALILALFVALVQSTVPLIGAARRHVGWMAVGRSCALIGLRADRAGDAGADARLRRRPTSRSSTSSENSHTDKPLLYKITGVWGNHEGSMLLWVFMLSLCAAAVALFSDNLPPALRARVLAVQGMIARRVPAVHPAHLQPVPAHLPAAAERQRAEPGAAGSRPRLPSAVPLPRLCRLLGRLLLRRRRPDRGPGRRRLGALGAALDAGLLVRPDHRHRHGLLVGLLHAGLGRLVVLGPGGERLASCPGWSAPR